MRGSLERARAELAARLRERREEIEEALLTRTYAIADPTEAADPEYAQGLRAAVFAALDYGLAAVEHGEERAPPVPVLLLAQARLAARNGVPLDTVLRRYFAGYTLLGDFIVQEAGVASLKEAWLKRLLREQAALFDRFLTTVTEEHGHEGDASLASTEERRAERVKRLLDGELVDTTELGYELQGHHLGLSAQGPKAGEVIRELAAPLDCRLLMVRHDGATAWAWIGGRSPLNPAEVLAKARAACPARVALALGESAEGLAGWRLTHRQALAALQVALRGGEPVVRYADVALLASMIQDDLLVTSLRELFLTPLERERDGGEVIKHTLRAYFAFERNVSSAAASLGVSRQAVNARLRTIEGRLGAPPSSCAVEMELALRLEDLDGSSRRRAG